MEPRNAKAPSHNSWFNLESHNIYSDGDTVALKFAVYWDREGLKWLINELKEIHNEMDKL